MTVDEFIDMRVRRKDYLTDQDNAYINVINSITKILMTYGSDEDLKSKIESINHYIDKYSYPAGLAQRVCAYDDAVEEAVREYEQNFSNRSSE